jgi:hypothetical protein
MTRIGVAAICSVLLTPGSWVGQDPTARVLTSKDIRAEIGTDTDTGSVMAQVLTHLMVNHERREFFLASQIPTEWLPSTPGVEFVRLADAEVVGHISACGVYWLVEKVERVDNVVSMMLNQTSAGLPLPVAANPPSAKESRPRIQRSTGLFGTRRTGKPVPHREVGHHRSDRQGDFLWP